MSEVYVRSGVSASEERMEYILPKPPALVWEAWVRDIDAWWLPSLRVTTPPSVMKLDAWAGGRLYEVSEAGEEYLWFRVSHSVTQNRLVLIQHTTPWAGPFTAHLLLDLYPYNENETRLILTMHVMGCIYEELGVQIHEAWDRLIGEGLKQFLEH